MATNPSPDPLRSTRRERETQWTPADVLETTTPARAAAAKASMARTVSGLNALVGVWLLISAWVVGTNPPSGSIWSNAICGIVIAIIAGLRAFRMPRVQALAWINLVLGVWTFFTPWIFGFAGTLPGRTWNECVVGIVVVALSLWSMGASATASGPSRTDLR